MTQQWIYGIVDIKDATHITRIIESHLIMQRKYIIIMITKEALQKKKKLARPEAGEKHKRGGVKSDFTPILPKNHQSFTRAHGNHHWQQHQAPFVPLCFIFFAFLSSHSSKCHLHLILPFPCDVWCFVCCFLCNVCEVSCV